MKSMCNEPLILSQTFVSEIENKALIKNRERLAAPIILREKTKHTNNKLIFPMTTITTKLVFQFMEGLTNA